MAKLSSCFEKEMCSWRRVRSFHDMVQWGGCKGKPPSPGIFGEGWIVGKDQQKLMRKESKSEIDNKILEGRFSRSKLELRQNQAVTNKKLTTCQMM